MALRAGLLAALVTAILAAAVPASAAADKGCCWWVTVKAKGKVVLTWPADPFATEDDKNGEHQGTYTREWAWTSIAIVDYELNHGPVVDDFDERTRALLDSDFHESSDLCLWEKDRLQQGSPFGCWPKHCDQRWRTGGLVTYSDTSAYFARAKRKELLGARAPVEYTRPFRGPKGSCEQGGRGPISSEAVHLDVGNGPWEYYPFKRPAPAKLLGKQSFNVKPHPDDGSHGEQVDTVENIKKHSSEARTSIIFCFNYIAKGRIDDAAEYLKQLADPKEPDHKKKLPTCEL